MKTLIVEDDFTSRLFLQELLRPFGETHTAENAWEALTAFQMSLDAQAPYDLICLDIMMPGMDGHQVLKDIRQLEQQYGNLASRGAKIIMTTILDDSGNVLAAFREQCDAYLVKPFHKDKLLQQLQAFGLIEWKNL
jgi:two-component system chemotaxis response regulator CheY